MFAGMIITIAKTHKKSANKIKFSGIMNNSTNTTCITDKFKLVYTEPPGIVRAYWVTLTYCIVVPSWLNTITAKSLITESVEDAKDYEHSIRANSAVYSANAVRTSIDNTFKLYLKTSIPSSSVSSQACAGNITCNRMKYSDIWGNCN